MKKEIFKLYKYIFIISLPFIILTCTFLITDPFGIIHNETPLSEPSGDYLATQRYLNNTKSIEYNAFVFGNSKTLAFTSADWKQILKDSLVFYKFGCPGESIYNIENKVKLILNSGDKIKYAIILLDGQIINNVRNTDKYLSGPVYKHHWLTSNETFVSFALSYYKYYINNFNFIKFFDYQITGKYKPYMEGVITAATKDQSVLETSETHTLTNEFYLTELEKEIATNGFQNYYLNHSKEFSGSKALSKKEPSVSEEDLESLENIKQMFDASQTNYKIIIAPDYNKISVSSWSLSQLRKIFGNSNVFDYSGNNDLAADSTNFYERTHFRPLVGRYILERVYD